MLHRYFEYAVKMMSIMRCFDYHHFCRGVFAVTLLKAKSDYKQSNDIFMSQVNSGSQRNFFSRFYVAGWLIAAVLAGCCLYLVNARNKLQVSNDIALGEQQQLLDSVQTDRTYLQTAFDAASVRIDQLMTRNSSLKDSMQGERTAIEKLQTRIKTIISDNESTRDRLLEARIMIYMLNERTEAYESYIAELERDNGILSGENEVLTNERDKTVARNIALRMEGSVLHTSNIRLQVLHERNRGKEKQTDRARRADKMVITFDIDENRIAESGGKEIYVRIIAPGNKLRQFGDLSGTIRTVKGVEIPYSLLKEVHLTKNQPLRNVTVEWAQADSFAKGIYVIELYNSGYLVGAQTVTLK